jgi:hypothetical protein
MLVMDDELGGGEVLWVIFRLQGEVGCVQTVKKGG